MAGTYRGKVVTLRQGEVMIVGNNAIRSRSRKIEVYVLGEDEIITPDRTRELGPFEDKGQIAKLIDHTMKGEPWEK